MTSDRIWQQASLGERLEILRNRGDAERSDHRRENLDQWRRHQDLEARLSALEQRVALKDAKIVLGRFDSVDFVGATTEINNRELARLRAVEKAAREVNDARDAFWARGFTAALDRLREVLKP